MDARHSFRHEADLSGARLQGAHFDEALLHRCCLRGVVAGGSSWRLARMVDADFRSGLEQLTDLGSADFTGSDLSFALMQGANLQGSCLYGANLRGCDLRGANLSDCDLANTQLEGARFQ
ncbi:MAG: pentapeptide repeat-containing protein [Cyanobacteriota bacterium]|nr:pentapeptide repeat-containing protein [Cyanobacteriota bacterium]